MLSYTKTAGFQTWEQEELNSAQFKTQVYIEIFYSANLGNEIAFPDDFPVVGPRPSYSVYNFIGARGPVQCAVSL